MIATRKVNCQISKERTDLTKFQMHFIHNVTILKMLEEMSIFVSYCWQKILYSLSCPVSLSEAIFDLSDASYAIV